MNHIVLQEWSRKGWFWQSVSRKEQLWNSCGRTLVFRTRVSVGEPPSHPNPTPCLLLFGHCHCHCFCLCLCLTGRGPFESVFPLIVALQTVIKLLAHFHLYTANKPPYTTTICRGSTTFSRFSIPIYPTRRDYLIRQKHLFFQNFWAENKWLNKQILSLFKSSTPIILRIQSSTNCLKW